jgi:hypothetical protein
MSIELNHIIIPARSKWASATFLASILDVPAGPQRELFVPVTVGNVVTLGYVDAERFDPHHCAFLPARQSSTPRTRASAAPESGSTPAASPAAR